MITNEEILQDLAKVQAQNREIKLSAERIIRHYEQIVAHYQEAIAHLQAIGARCPHCGAEVIPDLNDYAQGM